MSDEQKIEVYADWHQLQQPTLVGYLHAIKTRGKETFAFEYSVQWLKETSAINLDPDLQLYQGGKYAAEKQNNFGIFLDSAPDRWGRFLMQRREALLAQEGKHSNKLLLASDYLLGVYDKHRLGALRFKLPSSDTFLDNNPSYAAPPWTKLAELEQASRELERNTYDNVPINKKWLNMLIAPSASLGGARPKANFLDKNNCPWIAKFPSNNDEIDIGAWEMLVNQLANQCGITTPNAQVMKLGKHHTTFLSQRFDRISETQRIHFASAMTMLQRQDGDDASSGASYLELAEFIMQHGAQPNRDLAQLWRRIVFSICISNTDDHLRNHGFLFIPQQGWILSPAYDLNPNPYGDGLKLNISEFDNRQNLELAKEVSPYFRIPPKQAKQIILNTIQQVINWRELTKPLNISHAEQELMSPAFRVAEQA